MQLTDEQKQAVKNGEPPRFHDPDTNTDYVLVRADVYDRLRALLSTDGELDPESTYPLVDETFRDDWDDPRMAEYDDYESHKS